METTRLDNRPSESIAPFMPGRLRLALVWIAPALLTVGTVLMMTPDAWTVSHALYLAGAVGMLPVSSTLGRHLSVPLPASRLNAAGATLTAVGALALSGQFVIDFVVMELAGGESEIAGDMFADLQQSWVLAATFYWVGPALLFIGLSLTGFALVRAMTPAAGWILASGGLLMGLARVIDERAVEVAALVLILGALGWIARMIRDAAHARETT